MHDPATYDEYRRQVMPTIERHGGRFLARGATADVKEGSWRPTRLGILAFPSLAAAQAWYSDPEYVRLTRLRQTAGKDHLVILEGV